MRKSYFFSLVGLALVGAAVTPSLASAGGGDDSPRRCTEEFHAAVVEDNEAYAAKDAERYEAVLHPRMVFWYDGVATHGRDAIMETARRNFAVPGWTWTYEIESVTVHGCSSGIAVATARYTLPEQNIDRRFAFTMYLVRERGKWLVAADNVHKVSG